MTGDRVGQGRGGHHAGREGRKHRDRDHGPVTGAPAAEQVHAPDREERHVDDGAEEIEDAEDRAVPSVGRTCRERARRHGEQGEGDAPRQLVAPPPRQPALERRQAEGERHQPRAGAECGLCHRRAERRVMSSRT